MLERRRCADSVSMQQTLHPSECQKSSDADSVVYGSVAPPVDALKKLHGCEKKVTSQEMTVNLIAGGLGAGIFSLPWSTAGASIIPGLFIIAAGLIVNAGTIMILVEAAEITNTFDLGGLLSHLPGRIGQFMQPFCNCLVWASGFMSLISYFIIVSDSVVPFSSGTIFQNRDLVVCMIAAAAIPLSFLTQKEMSWTSSLVVIVNIYIFMLLAHLYENDPEPNGICLLGFSVGNIAMVSAMMQAVMIQMCILPMYGQLEDRSPRKFFGVLSTAFSALFGIFGGFAVIAYMAFGPNVHGNVLVDLPHSLSGNFGRVSASASVIGCFPLLMMPMMAPIENCSLFRDKDVVISKKVATGWARVFLLMLVMVATFFVHDLGIMNVVNGAMCVGGMVGMFPALVGIYILEKQNPFLWKSSMVALLVLGLTMSALGLTYTDNYAWSLKGSCLWNLK